MLNVVRLFLGNCVVKKVILGYGSNNSSSFERGPAPKLASDKVIFLLAQKASLLNIVGGHCVREQKLGWHPPCARHSTPALQYTATIYTLFLILYTLYFTLYTLYFLLYYFITLLLYTLYSVDKVVPAILAANFASLLC